MLEHFIDLAERHCAADVSMQIQALDLTQDDSRAEIQRLSQRLGGDDGQTCMEALVGYLSYSLTRNTSVGVVEGYLKAALNVHPAHHAPLRDAVEHGYSLIDLDAVDQQIYFVTAGVYRIDLNYEIHARFADRPFSDRTDQAYGYHAYLSLIEDPKGPEGFAAALDRAKPDLEATSSLISSLTTLAINMKKLGRNTDGIRQVLTPFREDARRTSGTSGPGTGPSIADRVTPALALLDR